MSEANQITLVEDSPKELQEKFPGMNCFRIKRNEETVGRCVGFVCQKWKEVFDWARQERDEYLDVKGLMLPVGIFYEINIFPQFRGSKFATPATNQFLKWFEGHGCSYVILNAVKQGDCTVDLVRLYEKSGFNIHSNSRAGKIMVWAKGR